MAWIHRSFLDQWPAPIAASRCRTRSSGSARPGGAADRGMCWVIPPPRNCPKRGLIKGVLTVTVRGNDPRYVLPEIQMFGYSHALGLNPV